MPASMEDSIRATLSATFAPERLVVTNESHLHHGHAGSPGTGESHFRVEIATAAFTGLSRVERHRLVNTALADAFARGLHALALRADGL